MGNKASSSSSNSHPKTMSSYIRRAQHAGSWYDDDPKELEATLDRFLSNVSADVPTEDTRRLRGLIGPHAGYSYSGPTAAYAYKELTKALKRQSEVKTILVLHPSHHVWLDGCALSNATTIETPMGNLTVNETLRQELAATKEFSCMKQQTDEDEHSGELHYPYIYKSLKDASRTHDIKVLAIMVGGINPDREAQFGKVLAKTIARSDVITIVSSDFCHWGKRFQYQPTSTNATIPIYEHIKTLDHEGMSAIELQEPGAFVKYIQASRNTVCGRHPIAVWMHAIAAVATSSKHDIKFIRYDQSSRVKSMRDSSVSYASAVARLVE